VDTMLRRIEERRHRA